MRHRRSILLVLFALVWGCAENHGVDPADAGASGTDSGVISDTDSGSATLDGGGNTEPDCRTQSNGGDPVVYAHGVLRPLEGNGGGTDMLAVIDPVARTVTRWVELNCMYGGTDEIPPSRDQFIDMAVGADGRIVMAGANAFFELNPETFECTPLRVPYDVPNPTAEWGFTTHRVETPNNLTFVPIGVLDTHREVVAGLGYRFLDQDDPRDLTEAGFLQYDPETLESTLVYDWPEDLHLGISGDLVVVVDSCTFAPRSFATLVGPRERGSHCQPCAEGETPGVDCGDCLYEFDVRNGRHLREIALLPASGVFGLALWGDTVLGFAAGDYSARESGKVIAVTPGDGTTSVEEVDLALPEGFASVHWMGAGSTTRAPILF